MWWEAALDHELHEVMKKKKCIKRDLQSNKYGTSQ